MAEVRKLVRRALLAGRLEAFGHEELGEFSLGSNEFDLDGGETLIAEA